MQVRIESTIWKSRVPELATELATYLRSGEVVEPEHIWVLEAIVMENSQIQDTVRGTTMYT